MEDVTTTEDLDSGRKKTVALSVLALGALAAGGERHRRRRQADSSEERVRKGAILVLVLVAIAALVAMGARRRRAQNSEIASTNGATAVSDASDADVESIVTEPVAASGG